MQIPGPCCQRGSSFLGLGWGPEGHISNKLPGLTDATLEEAGLRCLSPELTLHLPGHQSNLILPSAPQALEPLPSLECCQEFPASKSDRVLRSWDLPNQDKVEGLCCLLKGRLYWNLSQNWSDSSPKNPGGS